MTRQKVGSTHSTLNDYEMIAKKVDNLLNKQDDLTQTSTKPSSGKNTQEPTDMDAQLVETLMPLAVEEQPKHFKQIHETPVAAPKKESSISEHNTLQELIFDSPEKTLPSEQTTSEKPQFQNTFVRTDFGWKGLGSREIKYNKERDEYIYEVTEPQLSSEEQEILQRLVYLFSIIVTVDVEGVSIQKRSIYLEDALSKIIKENHVIITQDQKDRIFYHIYREFIGYGKIDILMHDDVIEDISCDGINIPIFIYHRELDTIRTNIIFTSSEELDNYVVKLAQICGKQISVYDPIVDGKLEDGSRLSVTLSKTVTKDSNFTIRRFRDEPFTPIDLLLTNTMDLEMAAYFWLAIENNSSILFCGGTASGKTTTLNALALFIPASHKIVSIEDTREVNLPHENWIAGTTRTGFSQSEERRTGKDIDMFDLTRAALRQRPKVIIIGEVRGREAYTLFQAMTTGHLSYSTVHAGDIRTLIQRLESPPINLPRSLLTALDMVVFLNSVTVDKKPVRRITTVMEILRLDSGTNRLITFTPFSWIFEGNDEFKHDEGSRILSRIKNQNGWSDTQLDEEIEQRKNVLRWMLNHNIRSYQEVTRIIADFHKNPAKILALMQRDGI
ncbi:MAG: type II/IV secretion system ATPase subunit [Candidatus Thermoplasmatota archaeon]|nr:type II/IV secretion system ATPase subunit [Candidatus Thermoplasmatota archaeon]MBU1941516.1 type II/IV secretion system ATPase subunit [Candidatus Thermoplasmatota archaeon]